MKGSAFRVLGLVLLCALAPLSAQAAQYYVNFEAGSDSNAGTSIGAPWKHHPDDAAATGTAASTSLSAGDTVWFKGGVVYYGRLDFGASGTANNRILHATHPSWGSGKAIIDSTTNAIWTVCTAEGTNTTQVNNPNFASIYYTALPSGFVWPLTVMEGTNWIYPAGSPHPTNRFYWMDTEHFTAQAGSISGVGITNASVLNQSSVDYWRNGIVAVHITGNGIGTASITNFIPSADAVQFPSLGVPYADGNWDGNYHWTMLNAQSQLTRGSYVVDSILNRVLVWPTNDINNVRLGFHSYAIHTQGASYNTISNITLRGQQGNSYQSGRVIAGSTSTPTDGLVIDRVDAYCSTDGGATAAFYVYGAGNVSNIIQNCTLSRLYGRGIFWTGVGNIIRTNEIFELTGTLFYTQNNSTISNRNFSVTDNYAHDCLGIHANGLSLYGGAVYPDAICSAGYVARNRILRRYHRYGPYVVSMQLQTDIHLENNVFDGRIADDGAAVGDHMRWINNTITGDLRIFYAQNVTDCIVRNNIIGYGLWNSTGEDWADITYSHNLYTNLNFRQSITYGWTIGTGEALVTLADIWPDGFTDGSITTASDAASAGTDTLALMLEDYDAAGTAWTLPLSIGAYRPSDAPPPLENNTPRTQQLRIPFRQK